jgi:cytochrome c-type biogenesis protein CcmH/NrfG
LGQRDTAAEVYRQTVTKHPDFADGWNNLAQVLLDLGHRYEAGKAITRAVALAGPRLSEYLALQAQINKK